MITRRAALYGLGASAVALPANAAAAGARQLAPDFAGLSYEKTQLRVPYFTPDNSALVRLYRQLGPGSLRIGANGVDTSSWRGAVAGLAPIEPGQVDAFAAFVRRTGWSVIWGVNFARNTPGAAAEEAAYVARRLGPSLQAIEIGNEPDLYAGNGFRSSSYRFQDFLGEWRRYATAIRSAVPHVRLSGPAAALDAQNYTLPFVREEGRAVDLVTQHYYRANGQSPSSTLDLLLRPDRRVIEEAQALSAAASSNDIKLGCRFAECNSFYNGGAPGVSRSFGTALWVLDFLFQLAANGISGANLHGGGNGPGYTPIADSSGVVVGPRPIFYGLLAFRQAGTGHVVPVHFARPYPAWFSAHGVLKQDGLVDLVLLNKNPTASLEVALPKSAGGRISVLRLQAPALDAIAGVTLGGATIGADGSWHPAAEEIASNRETVVLHLPRASAAIVQHRA
ncbi:glycosyl hydrolase family protein [Lichenicoccus sp.]|uniref:glycosyl hydrolase family 79 C-terminal domain-containing protein n=1 Tax=Lichenicoccus sp. TaxID=2781899 RepID=UPI003D0B0A0A